MAKEWIKATEAGDAEMNEAMRRVRKGVVNSIMTSAPRMSAAKWLEKKRTFTGTEK
jgi:hypothetical protein